MPRATKFLKEDIIEAASAVVKKEGLSAINARRGWQRSLDVRYSRSSISLRTWRT